MSGLPPEGVVVVIGCVVLLGWLFDVAVFKSVAPGLPSMKANAAVASVLAGVGLWLLRATPQSVGRRLVARACAAGVVLIGSLTLCEFLFGWDLGIDQLLFHEPPGVVGASSPGRMGANAAVIFILDGFALFLLDVERWDVRPAQLLALASGVIAFVALSGYVSGAVALTAFGSATHVALNAAFAYLVMSAALLSARPHAGLMALVTSRGAGGLAIRRLVVPAIAVPLLLGWLVHRGERGGLYEPEQALALLVVAVSLFFLRLTWLTARSLERADAERGRALDELRVLNDELEQRVRVRTAQLEAANRELEAFSYSVSHDLRAPLRAIDGFSRLLLDEYADGLPSEARRYLGIVGKSTQDMGRLIDGLLSFSRLGQRQLGKRSVDVGRLAREVVAELDAARDGRAVEVSIGALAPARADPTLLRQVLVNLLSNALKYTRQREAARIEIGCRDDDGVPVYFVRDNGVGFDMRYAGKLFRVFQRLHRAEEYEGTGVGLALVARIVARHGGRIWAEARPDEGAAFYFTLNGGRA